MPENRYLYPHCNQETDKVPHSSLRSLYHKAGNHPLIQSYNLWIDQLEELEKGIRGAGRAEKMPHPKYGNPKVVLCSRPDPDEDGFDTVRITEYLLNGDEKEAWMARWGSITGGWDSQHISVAYYRTTEGILTHTGGGYTILVDPQLISEEEWEQFKAGDIPQHLWDTKETD